MKYRLFPVILTAALTSVMTLLVVSHFQQKTPYFGMAADPAGKVPVSYTGMPGGPAGAAPVNFENAAANSVKAVVHIRSTINGRTVTTNSNDMFSRLFGQQQYFIPGQQESGSGVVISPDGYIVTNNHVVANGDEITVTFNDRFTANAKLVGADPGTDIAVLKVEGRNDLSYLEFGNSDEAKLGQWVLAVGYPLSLDATVTAGIISAKGRAIGVNKSSASTAIESFIQTDAAVNPGNSGGALVNTSGQLIGINSAIASPTGSYAGYSYAVPSNIVRKAVNDLMKYGSVQRGYLGVEFFNTEKATPEQMTQLGLDKTPGVLLTRVFPGSGAYKAGLREGDFITQINGQPVNNEPELRGQIAHYQPGDNISVAYVRNGNALTASVQLTNQSGTLAILKEDNGSKLLGATFRPLSRDEKLRYNINGGLLLTDPGNGQLAKHTQMARGFVITGVNNNVIGSVTDLKKAINGTKDLLIAGFYPGRTGMCYFQVQGLNDVSGVE